MKQWQKETELEKFSPSTHAAHLLKPKENNQKKHAIAKLASYCIPKYVFPLLQETINTCSTVARTERLSQNGEVVELRTSEAISPNRHLVSHRSHDASNGADWSQGVGSNSVKTRHKPRSRGGYSIQWGIAHLSPSSMHVPKSNKQPLSDEKRCRRIWIPIPGRPTWLGGNWDTSIGQFNCADRTRRTLCYRRKPWKDQRSIAAGFTMTKKAVQKIPTIPLHARTWWVRLSRANTHTPRHGFHDPTITFSH